MGNSNTVATTENTDIATTESVNDNILPQNVTLDNVKFSHEHAFNDAYKVSNPGDGTLQTVKTYRANSVETAKIVEQATVLASRVKGAEVDSFSPEYNNLIQEIRNVGKKSLEDIVRPDSPLLRGRVIIKESNKKRQEMGDNLLELNRNLESINTDLESVQKSCLNRLLPSRIERSIEEKTISKDEAIAKLRDVAVDNYKRSVQQDAQLRVVTEDYRDNIANIAKEMRLLWELDIHLVNQLEEESGGDPVKREELFNSKYSRLIATNRARYNNLSMNVLTGTINLIMFNNAHRSNESIMDIAENASTFGVANIYGQEILDSVLKGQEESLEISRNINEYSMNSLKKNVERGRELSLRTREMANTGTADISTIEKALEESLAISRSLANDWRELAQQEDLRKTRIQAIVDNTQKQIRELSLEMPEEARTMLAIESE